MLIITILLNLFINLLLDMFYDQRHSFSNSNK